MIESKHGRVRSTFIRLKEDMGLNAKAAAVKAVPISNDLYGSSIILFLELAKAFIKTVDNSSVDEL